MNWRAFVNRVIAATIALLATAGAAAQCDFSTSDSRAVDVDIPTVTYRLEFFANCDARLIAEANGEQVIVMELDSESFGTVWIETVGDFDGDGFEDALIGFFMGNCCPPYYKVATAVPGQAPTVEALPGWYNSMEYSDGVFTLYEPDAVIKYRFADGRLVLLDHAQKALVPTTVTMTIDMAMRDDWIPGTIEPLDIDIDGDGLYEQLACALWKGVACDIVLGDGTQLSLGYGCLRFGQSHISTNEYSDLVCESNIVLKWDGNQYQRVNEVAVCPNGVTAEEDLFKLAASFGSYSEQVRHSWLACGPLDPQDEYGQTPIFYAIAADDAIAVREFLEYGHDYDYAAMDGWTPLLMAVRDTTEPQVVMELLRYGASTLSIPSQGRRHAVLRFAQQNPALNGNEAMIALIAGVLIEEAVAAPDSRGSTLTQPGTGAFIPLTRAPREAMVQLSTIELSLNGNVEITYFDEVTGEPAEIGLTAQAMTLSQPLVLGHKHYLARATYVPASSIDASGNQIQSQVGSSPFEALAEEVRFEVLRLTRESVGKTIVALGGENLDSQLASQLNLFNIGDLLILKAESDEVSLRVGSIMEKNEDVVIDGISITSNEKLEVTDADAKGYEMQATSSLRAVGVDDGWLEILTILDQDMNYKIEFRAGQLDPERIYGTISLGVDIWVAHGEPDQTHLNIDLSGPIKVVAAGRRWLDVSPQDRRGLLTQILNLILIRL